MTDVPVPMPLWKVTIGYQSGNTGWTWRRAPNAGEAIRMVRDATPRPKALTITAEREEELDGS